MVEIKQSKYRPYKYRPYRCLNCGHEQEMQTNHEDICYAYCKGCSWKPSFGEPEYNIKIPPLGTHTYRPFEFIKEEGK